MKTGLYIQDYRNKGEKKFNKIIGEVKKAELDLFVFPECCYTPYPDDYYGIDILMDDGLRCAKKRTMQISREAGCAVIVSAEDKYGMIYSIYANAFADRDDTEWNIYYKHTMTVDSAMGLENYSELIGDIFSYTILKGKRIGMTICYDCNHSAFSRAYGNDGVDILINCTGGNIVYKKWYQYNKVRAMENNCVNLCTMGFSPNDTPNSYTFGFTSEGSLIKPVPLFPCRDEWDTIGNIFVYDTEAKAQTERDLWLDQVPTVNKYGDFAVTPEKVRQFADNAECIEDGLYVLKDAQYNIVAIFTDGDEIVKPENILKKMYSDKLKTFANKRYVIINTWSALEQSYFETTLSDILKVRSMENFCAVVLDSPGNFVCYQCGKNRSSQIIAPTNGKYLLDLSRMSGPEAIWKDKPGMKGKWRSGFEELIKWI